MEEQPMPVKKTENLLEYETSEVCAQSNYRASRGAERRYRAFLEFLPDPVFVLNLDATVSYLNPAFVKVLGGRPRNLRAGGFPSYPII
jgi:PAS domain-containing protein